ncbi:hypothetical protein BH10PSE1_BH10PSE1_07630 [soil metagenome]
MLLFRPLMRYADFKGRASRAEYWLFMTSQGLVYGGCLFMGALGFQGHSTGAAFLGLIGWLAVIGILVLALALPNYAVLARRLHDSGRSARWMALLLPNVATQFAAYRLMGSLAQQGPISGLDGGVALKQAAMHGMAGVSVIAIIATICQLVLFVMTMMPGTRGPNPFGPDPRDPDAVRPSENDGLDEDRWDALIAEAKGAGRAEEPYKPVFDFGPGPVAEPPPVAPFPAQIDWGRPAWDPGVTPSRPFGRRS